MKILEKMYTEIMWLVTWFAKISMIVMVLIVTLQVILRAFNTGIPWVQEVSLLCMVWFGFIAMAIGIRQKLHISIQVLVSRFPKKTQDIIIRTGYLLIAVFSLVMIKYGIGLVGFTSRSTLPATGLKSSIQYIILPISGALMFINALIVALGLEDRFRLKEEEAK